MQDGVAGRPGEPPPAPDHLRLLPLRAQALGANLLDTQSGHQALLGKIREVELLVLDSIGTLTANGDMAGESWRALELWVAHLRQTMSVLLLRHTPEAAARGGGRHGRQMDAIIGVRHPFGWRAGATVQTMLRFERAAHEPGCEGEWLGLTLRTGGATRWEVDQIERERMQEVGRRASEGQGLRTIKKALGITHHQTQKLGRWSVDEGLVVGRRGRERNFFWQESGLISSR